jgi:hypothetical protein
MSAVPRVLEAGKFKRVEAGYVLRPPSASFLHRTQAYRVNQAQKAEILSRAALEKGRWTPWLTPVRPRAGGRQRCCGPRRRCNTLA